MGIDDETRNPSAGVPEAAGNGTSDSSRSNHPKERERGGKKQKRARVDEDADEDVDVMQAEIQLMQAQQDRASAEISRSSKRKRLDLAIPGAEQEVADVMPVALETEDISEEVQRRLKIKEERRKKRDAKAEKRKRDSLASNGSASASSPGGVARPRKKKVKTSGAGEGGGEALRPPILSPRHQVANLEREIATQIFWTKRHRRQKRGKDSGTFPELICEFNWLILTLYSAFSFYFKPETSLKEWNEETEKRLLRMFQGVRLDVQSLYLCSYLLFFVLFVLP